MNKVQETLPNVVGGVSQQPPSLRRPEQCSEQINALASTVEGMVKRPPFELVVGASFNCATNDPFVHQYSRGDRDYAVVIESGIVRVIDLKSGTTSVAEIDPAALPYFQTNGLPHDTFDAITVQDTTFVANKSVSTAIINTPAPDLGPDAIVFWRGSGYGERFTLRITLDDGTSAEWLLHISDPPSSGTPPQDPLKTNMVAEAFDALLSGGSSSLAGADGTSPGSLLDLLGLEHEREGSRIRIRGEAGNDFTIYVEDGQSGNYMRSVQGKVDKVSDLPSTGFPDFLIRVAGNSATIVDDYWVRWDGTVWVETVNPQHIDKPDAAKMPHILRPKEGGGWEVKPYTWASRSCGDLVTNPSPSFVDEKITGLFFHRDRLGLLTSDSKVMSETSEYGNFYRTTVTTVVGSDPIDVLTNEPLYAFPYDRNLLIFGNSRQSIATAEGPFTAATLALTEVTQFDMEPTVRPYLSGRSVFFCATNAGYSRIKRFSPLAEKAGGYDEKDVCVHVPRYVPANLRRLAASESERILICVPRGSASPSLRVYQWLDDGNEVLMQSAWHTWTLPAPVTDAFFAGATLYALIRRGGALDLVSCDLTPNRSDTGLAYRVALDHRVDETSLSSREYDDVLDRTTLVLPSPVLPGAEYRAVARAGAMHEGEAFPALSATGSTVVVDGNASTAPIYLGCLYSEQYDFSEFVLRDRDGIKRPIERVSVGLIDLTIENSGEMDVIVSAKGRPVRTIDTSPRTIGDGANLLNRTALRSGTIRVPIRARADRVSISIQSRSHLPLRVTSAAWRGSYSDRQAIP